MHNKLVFLSGAARFLVLSGVGLTLTAGLAGCKNEVDVAPQTDTAYYPVAVGNSWTYAVADTTWSEARFVNPVVVPSVATVSAFKLRETITETFTDAAGRKAYRLVRAKMVPPSTAWVDDSVFVLTANEQFVALSRNNVRTVELVFPVKEEGTWNLNAFNNSAQDTVTNQTRQYLRAGQPYSTGGGTTGLPSKAYSTTVTTNNTGTAAENSLIKRSGYQQVFAKGVGPVLRRRFSMNFFNYPDPNNTSVQIYVAGSYFAAKTRHETLIDYVVK
ncbi:hypothetical protein MUN81_12000 [Hymenobacter sp. 5317J-9]|uniref:hypothetical protein n=1 Tax=Hymenobacter sp. 5317J-9 TaxID=2932250 RepID=UPI001FD68561|nr:hypothetical protein [Hymenobacter sp. 5317J-9]UOQ95985.1 hypothetical protein MUN81_12000 [Hymenobacter sp. 5317J-9]